MGIHSDALSAAQQSRQHECKVWCSVPTVYALSVESFRFARRLNEQISGGIAVEHCRKLTKCALEHFALQEVRCEGVRREYERAVKGQLRHEG